MGDSNKSSETKYFLQNLEVLRECFLDLLVAEVS